MNARFGNRAGSRRQALRQSRTARANVRRGVTLMELIVALTVTGFMAAVGTAAFTSIIDNRHLIRESTAPNRTRDGASRDDSPVVVAGHDSDSNRRPIGTQQQLGDAYHRQ